MGSAEVHAILTHLALEKCTQTGSLARKQRYATTEWGWQWIFPQNQRWQNPNSEQQERHHLDPSMIPKLVPSAVLAAGICNPAGCRSLRHCFATHLLERRQDIGAIEELIDLNDPRARMIHTHLPNRRPMGVANPADLLQRDGKELLAIPGPYKIPTNSPYNPPGPLHRKPCAASCRLAIAL
jgi:hypothetical protein